MFSALYRGLYNFGSVDAVDSFLPKTDCPSGNCTWLEPYSTIGVCGRCTDVTAMMVSSEPDLCVQADADRLSPAERTTTSFRLMTTTSCLVTRSLTATTLCQALKVSATLGTQVLIHTLMLTSLSKLIVELPPRNRISVAT